MNVKIYGLLFLTLLCQKAIASELVKVKLGGDTYQIPSIYLSPHKDIKPEIERRGSIEVSLFLPDYAGFTEGRNYPTVEKYNPNQLSVLWTEKGQGSHFSAKKRLGNSLKYGLIEPNGTKLEGFVSYRHLYDDGVTYLSTSREGDKVMINCSGIVNYICKLKYLNSKREIGIFIAFDQSHLSNWFSINDQLIKMIDAWKS